MSYSVRVGCPNNFLKLIVSLIMIREVEKGRSIEALPEINLSSWFTFGKKLISVIKVWLYFKQKINAL